MRLLTYDSVGNLDLTRDLADNVPPYAILSHTWATDEDEVTFSEVQSESCKVKAGYVKIQFCGRQAKKDGLEHFWIDTCCINKANHVELSEAITSMYRWYRNANVCYVHLMDVSYDGSKSSSADRPWESSLRKSRWFTRGWTLQELLAPKDVVFYSKEGERIGTKDELRVLLHEITSIPIAALSGRPLSRYSINERLSWTKGRETKKKEDQAYCLLGIFNVFIPLNYGEGDNAFIRLTKKINKSPRIMSSLKVADGASFDSYGQAHQGCHPDTRVDELQSIRDWAREADGRSIFWMNGMAGTGKSTISYSTAKWLADLGASDTVALGASFFFERGTVNRASAALLFPTIANQLAINIKNFDVFLAQAVDNDPQVCSKSLQEQFKHLIRRPLQNVSSDDDDDYLTYIIVVDALDECDNEADIRTVLQLWASFFATDSTRLRLFLSSRPELMIRRAFQKMPSNIHYDLVLHEVPEQTIRHDIHAFLRDALSDIREEHNLDLTDEPLAIDWPGSQALQTLVDMAVPLFIIAATLYRLIRDAERPQQYLDKILKSPKSGQLVELIQVYKLILESLTASKNKDDLTQAHHEFRTIVGAIITLSRPLSRSALASLLNITSTDVQICLRPLYAVFRVPTDTDLPIRSLHVSFGEYLTSKAAQGSPYWIDPDAAHESLWRNCLHLLSSCNGLKENICQLTYPGQLCSEVPSACLKENLPPAVRYACRYWVHHVQSSHWSLCDEDEIHGFLKRHFLHWLEVLSLIGRFDDIYDSLSILHSLLAGEHSNHVKEFLEDGIQFVTTYNEFGECAPLQLYSSGIAFSPQNSAVRRICGKLPAWILQGPITAPTWESELHEFGGHTGSVNSITFAPNGLILASASEDETIRLWDTRTGQETQLLQGHTGSIKVIQFSPDNSQLASAADDETVRVWCIATGEQVHELEIDDWTMAIAFSPNGLLLATGSYEGGVRIWDLRSGLEIQRLGRAHRAMAVAFSTNSSALASGSYGGNVRLWNLETAQEKRHFKGHTDSITAVAFSSRRFLLASASYDKTVRVWHTRSGQELQILETSEVITKLAFTSDNSTLTTEFGNLQLDIASNSQRSQSTFIDTGLKLKRDWVECHGQKFLWLPDMYRTGVSAACGDTIGIGQRDGRVSILRLEYEPSNPD